MGSKSKTNLMKSYQIIKKDAEQKLKKQQKENALDILSKSLKKYMNKHYLNGSSNLLINLQIFYYEYVKKQSTVNRERWKYS